MSLRFKLIGAMVLVAMIVPVAGGVALHRLVAVDGQVSVIGDELPLIDGVDNLERAQREQEAAVRDYLSSGDREALLRFQESSRAFDAALAELQATAPSTEAGPFAEYSAQIVAEHAEFQRAAGGAIASRDSIDQRLTGLRADAAEIDRELTSLRQRYVPWATSDPVDPASLSDTVRTQVNDLLLGSEGMLRVIGLQFALATGYALAPDPTSRQQFDAATPVLRRWFDVASAAGGSEDRAILSRVLNRYLNAFEPGGRAMMQTADDAERSGEAMRASSTAITTLLGEDARGRTARVAAANEDAASIADGAVRLLTAVTLVAFVVAVVLGVWLANRIVGPLIRLRAAADRASRGDVANVEVATDRNDEVGDLARAIRRLLVSINVLIAKEQETNERDQQAVG